MAWDHILSSTNLWHTGYFYEKSRQGILIVIFNVTVVLMKTVWWVCCWTWTKYQSFVIWSIFKWQRCLLPGGLRTCTCNCWQLPWWLVETVASLVMTCKLWTSQSVATPSGVATLPTHFWICCSPFCSVSRRLASSFRLLANSFWWARLFSSAVISFWGGQTSTTEWPLHAAASRRQQKKCYTYMQNKDVWYSFYMVR